MFFGKIHRCFNRDLDIHVAAGLTAQHAHAFALEAELVAGLSALRDGDFDAPAIDRRHFDMAAQAGGREFERYGAIDVRAIALEDAVRFDGEENIEITRRPATETGFAFAGEADAGAFLDASGDGDIECFFAPRAAGAGAGFARAFDGFAGALAGAAGAFDGEEALLCTYGAAAVTGGAGFGRGAFFGARAVAGIAARRGGDFDGFIFTAECVLKFDIEVVAQVGTACGGGLCLRATATAAATGEFGKQILENIGEAAGIEP